MTERWTEFQGGPMRGRKDEARVTLNGRGVLLLNNKAYEVLGMPAAAKLLYDEDRRCIGLQPHDARHANAFPVKQKDKYYNRVIHITSFCRHFGIDIDREGLMKLELNRTVTIGKSSG